MPEVVYPNESNIIRTVRPSVEGKLSCVLSPEVEASIVYIYVRQGYKLSQFRLFSEKTSTGPEELLAEVLKSIIRIQRKHIRPTPSAELTEGRTSTKMTGFRLDYEANQTCEKDPLCAPVAIGEKYAGQ